MTQEEFDKAPKIEQVLYDCTGMLAKNHSDIIEAMTLYAESEVKRLNTPDVSKRFLVTYRYTNRTDAALHEDEVEARNCVEACNKVCANHNYEVEWHTVRDAP